MAFALASAAVLLGLAFQRVRSVLLGVSLLLSGVALQQEQTAFYAAIPALLVLVMASREPRWWSLRMLMLALLFGIAWRWSDRLLPWLASPAYGEGLATIGAGGTLVLLAVSVSLLRWVLRGAVLDFVHCLVLLVAMSAFSATSLQNPERLGLLALASALLLPGLLWAAYQMAFIDPLTGLPNRRALDERLARGGWRLGVAMVDVDFFKKVNDRHGHDVGDLVLRAVARQLARTRGATAYRYGGEEFCLVFSPRRLADANAILESLRERIQSMRVRTGRGPPLGKVHAVKRGSKADELRVTVSIGLASRTAETRTVEAVVKAADSALYRAKQRGRNCVVAAH